MEKNKDQPSSFFEAVEKLSTAKEYLQKKGLQGNGKKRKDYKEMEKKKGLQGNGKKERITREIN